MNFRKITFHLTTLLTITACNNANFSVEEASSGIGTTFAQGALASCSVINPATPFNSGSGTVSDPYIICSEQQLLNISQAVFDKSPSLTSAGEVKFPYMNKAFKLGASLNFSKGDVEFFSLGHYMASLGRSKAISESDKNLVATHDERNLSTYVDLLSSQRIPFNGSLDGNGNTIEIGDYAPTESRLVGLFSVLAPGAVIKNLNLKNFNIYSKGGVNIGCLAGSILDSAQIQVWKDQSLPSTSKKVSIDKVNIDGCKIYDAASNSGALVGVVRTYLAEELNVSNINLSNVLIDGSIETKFAPAYGDEVMQALPIINQFHHVGILAGYVQIDGKANFNNITIDKSDISLVGYYTGADREEDLGSLEYITNSFLEDYAFIFDAFSNGLSDTFSDNDPVRSVGSMFGSLNTSSNLARLTVSSVKVTESKSSFYETIKNVGTFSGNLGLLGGVVTIQDVSLSGNMIKFGLNELSLPSSGIGNLAGTLSIAGSGADYKFNRITIDGQIIGNNADSSGDISGFVGSIQALDEVVSVDTKVGFTDIKIAGIADLGGGDIRSLGSFAGSMTGTGEASAPSAGVNKITLTRVENDFVISTSDNYALVVGGLAGYLGRGSYTMNAVTVRTSIDTQNAYGIYNYVNSIIGMFSSNALVTVSASSYAPLRPEFVTGIPAAQDNFQSL